RREQLHPQARRLRRVRRHGGAPRRLLAEPQPGAARRGPPMTAAAANLRVLLVEDSPLDAKLIERQLRRAGFEPQHRRVATQPELREALRAEAWDIVLSDHALPGFSS